jgi:diamine N-acetyltransferase
VLTGPNVTLRALRDDDVDRMLAWLNDPLVVGMASFRPWAPLDATSWRARVAEDLAKPTGTAAWFAIEVGGELIGECGLWRIDGDAGRAELGITIGDQAMWGKGHGREAVGLLLGYAFRTRNLRRVFLETHAANPRAIASYRACGFVEEGRLREHIWYDGEYVDVVVMGLLRSEWSGST